MGLPQRLKDLDECIRQIKKTLPELNKNQIQKIENVICKEFVE